MYKSIEWIQAYKQAPWRQQVQFAGLFIIVVIIAAVVAGMYLNISASTTAVGREIQSLQYDARVLEREIKDLETDLAFLYNERNMARRAKALGFKSIELGTGIYIPVSGYAGRQTAQIAEDYAVPTPAPSILPESYTISWIDWAQDMLFQIGLQTGAVEE